MGSCQPQRRWHSLTCSCLWFYWFYWSQLLTLLSDDLLVSLDFLKPNKTLCLWSQVYLRCTELTGHVQNSHLLIWAHKVSRVRLYWELLITSCSRDVCYQLIHKNPKSSKFVYTFPHSESVSRRRLILLILLRLRLKSIFCSIFLVFFLYSKKGGGFWHKQRQKLEMIWRSSRVYLSVFWMRFQLHSFIHSSNM